MPKQANKPVFTVSIWPIKAAIWENQTKDGKTTFYGVTLERTYKDGDEYKSTGNLNRDDLLSAAKALDLAHTWILRQEAKDREASKGGED